MPIPEIFSGYDQHKWTKFNRLQEIGALHMRRLCRSALNWLKKRRLSRVQSSSYFGPVVRWEVVPYTFELDWYQPHRRDGAANLDAKVLTERLW